VSRHSGREGRNGQSPIPRVNCHLAVATCPDIAYAVGVLCHFVENPGCSSLQTPTGTVALKLIYSHSTSPDHFVMYLDTDLRGNPDNSRSTGDPVVCGWWRRVATFNHTFLHHLPSPGIHRVESWVRDNVGAVLFRRNRIRHVLSLPSTPRQQVGDSAPRTPKCYKACASDTIGFVTVSRES